MKHNAHLIKLEIKKLQLPLSTYNVNMTTITLSRWRRAVHDKRFVQKLYFF